MKTPDSRFTWITLGVEGGLHESNLNAHLLSPSGSSDYICLDAGTLMEGLKVAADNNCFTGIPLQDDLRLEGTILHHNIKAFLITHPYLDHCEGLVIASPNCSTKPLMSLPGVIDDIDRHLFNWRIWPNFGDRGAPPVLNVYRYVSMQAGEKIRIPGTSMNVEAHPLAHGEHTDSAAFLIESDGHYLLYMGDTGPDEIERRTSTEDLWKRIAPLIRDNRMHGIFIEASYTDERPDTQLFSHLTPAWLMTAFRKLSIIVDPQNPAQSLQGLRVIITHIKPDLSALTSPRDIIEKQLHSHNDLGLNFIFARQGRKYEL
jgi:3',5'-cyclic-nucleotide phosphodiesterase